ncbi:MAG: lysophospholipid acyltransferase family protein [Geminicoccaceae bacterium]
MIRTSAHQLAPRDQQKTSDMPITEPASWLQARDIAMAGLVLFLGFGSWVLPEKTWPTLARKLAARRVRRSSNFDTNELATVKVIVGDRSPSWIEQTFRPAWLAHKYHSWMQLLACYRPRNWQPSPDLIGRARLDAALTEGRGAILFTANFAYQDLMAKAAFAGAGYQINHLARDGHGFIESRLSRWLLNPIYTAIERRFLKEHLVFSGDRTKKVNAVIKAKLRDNELVMVLVTPLGRRITTLPFLHGQIRIATGALNFACETGAPVLPVFTVRKPDGVIETIVEPALERPKYRSRSETIETMLQDYVPRLEMYVAQYPDQFAFPSSSQHGEALIEPKTLPTKERKKPVPTHGGERIPELV